MVTCDDARARLALHPNSDDPELHRHLAECGACAVYGRRSQTLDVVLRTELRWEVPADLTARLLVLAGAPALVPAPIRPNRWYVMLVYALTIAVVALSLTVAVQFIGIISAQLGLADALVELLALPGRALQQLAQALPESRYAIDLALRVRDQLVWLLLAAVLWAAVDRYGAPVVAARQTT